MGAQPRKPKVSYSCLPCKTLKIKCDHQLPCSNCTKNNRQDQCFKNPPKSLSQFKELIRPNASFGRVSKQVGSLKSKQSIDNLSQAGGSLRSAKSVSNLRQNIGGSTGLLRSKQSLDNMRIGDVSLEQFIEQNYQLQQQINQLNNQLMIHQSLPTIHDLFTLSTEKKFIVVKSMLGFLPPQNVSPLIFKHYFAIDLLHPINQIEFEKLHNKFLLDLSHNREIDLMVLGLIFMVLSIGVLSLPKANILLYFPNHQIDLIKDKVKLWINSARQILILQPKPSLMKLQVMILLHIYFKDYENDKAILNSLLIQSINDAYDLRLHLDDLRLDTQFSKVELELRKKIWCYLFCLDVEKSITSSKPLIISTNNKLRLPSNCDDQDITADSVINKSMEIPTESSLIIARSQLYQILKKTMLYEPNLSIKLNNMIEVDKELNDWLQGLPWFFKVETCLNSTINDRKLLFQLNYFHIEFCILRFKIYQNFQNLDIPIVDSISLKIVNSMFDVYKKLKTSLILEIDPLFNTQKRLILKGLIHESMILLQDSNSIKFDKMDILKEINSIINDLEKVQINDNDNFLDMSQNSVILKRFKQFLTSKHTEFMNGQDSVIYSSPVSIPAERSTPYSTPPPSASEVNFQHPLEKMKLNTLLTTTIPSPSTSVDYGSFSNFSIQQSLDYFNSMGEDQLRRKIIRNSALINDYYSKAAYLI